MYVREYTCFLLLMLWKWFYSVAYRAQVPPGATTSNAALSGKNFFRWRKNVIQLAKKF